MLLSAYLPPFLSQGYTFSNLLKVEQGELEQVSLNTQDFLNQCFINTATWGLINWERFAGIQTDISKNISYRRTSVMSLIRGFGTINVATIENVVNSFVNGDIAVIEHASGYSFEIKFNGALGVPPNIADLQNIINQIKPAHLSVTYTYLYQQWDSVQPSTWATIKTGSWNDFLNGKVI